MIQLAFWLLLASSSTPISGIRGADGDLALQEDARSPGEITPRVSFIITAHNEEARIREKIDNTLAQDYSAPGARGHRRLGLLERPDGRLSSAPTRLASA